MQFLENGADIPSELIRSVEDGKAIFFCGAGVSMGPAEMPNFKGLTDSVYEMIRKTGEKDVTKKTPAEKAAYKKEEYDRVLRLLEKRIGPSRVRSAVAERLTAGEGTDTSWHLTVLRLSQDKEGRPRILTTNFDTLFERAAPDLPSHSGKAIPKPGGDRDHGIMHLHGRIVDDLNLPDNDLVLTSADFGEAYLRDGWASKYIEDRVRMNVLVLVGYSAEDAALRLLLETLDVDRERFPDLNPIYALGKRGDDSEVEWKAKGDTRLIEFDNYANIYDTMIEWISYIEDPRSYRHNSIQKITEHERNPENASNFSINKVNFCLGEEMRQNGLNSVISTINIPVRWIIWFFRNSEFEIGNPIVAWISRNFSNLNAVKDVADNMDYISHAKISRQYIRAVERELIRQEENLNPINIRCWRLILRYLSSPRLDSLQSEWFRIKARVKRGEYSNEIIKKIGEILEPKLKIQKRIPFGEEQRGIPEHPSELMHITFESEYTQDVDELLSAWGDNVPVEYEEKLLQLLTTTMEGAFDEAKEIELAWLCNFNVRSVARHKQNNYRTGFLPIARIMAEIWTLIASKDIAVAQKIVDNWLESNCPLTRRICLFAIENDVIRISSVIKMLGKLSVEELFLDPSTVELHRLLRSRWNGISPRRRKEIEARILRGPPANLFKKNLTRKEKARLIDRCLFDFLKILERRNLFLSAKAKKLLKDIEDRYPQWKLSPPEQDGFSAWSEGPSWVSEGDPNEYKGVPDNELISRAKELASDPNYGVAFGGWRPLCSDDPQRVLRGFKAEIEEKGWKEWPVVYWDNFLQSFQEKMEDKKSVVAETAQTLLEFPDDVFAKSLPSISWFLWKGSNVLATEHLWPLWDRIANCDGTKGDAEIQIMDDPLTESLNSSGGRLADILIQKLPEAEKEAEIPEGFRRRFDLLVNASGRFGTLARVRMAMDILFLFYLAPKWTTDNLLPLFKWSSPDAPMLWRVRKSGYIGSPNFVALTKKPFLALFGKDELNADSKHRFVEWLIVMMLENQKNEEKYPISLGEARNALELAGADFLPSAAHQFAIKMESFEPENKLSAWNDEVAPVFEGVWPLDIDLRTPKAAYKLIQLLLASGNAFPEAAETIIPLIQSEGPEQLGVYSISKAPDELFASYPEGMLDLVSAAIGGAPVGGVYGLDKILERIKEHAPALAKARKFWKLARIAGLR